MSENLSQKGQNSSSEEIRALHRLYIFVNGMLTYIGCEINVIMQKRTQPAFSYRSDPVISALRDYVHISKFQDWLSDINVRW